ncbi:hypothetical protein DFJ74DRAFT_697204 [Hyaloraphidium curvatum]|nr:hypothetical protein DFJ74DRAFT_697204 [Hyaloraphidium curvatum]
MQLVLAPLAGAAMARAAFTFVAFAAVLGASWAFPHGQFPQNNFVIGFAVMLVFTFQALVGQGLMATYRGSLRLPTSTSGPVLLDKHPLAPLVRWAEAQRAGHMSEHDPVDELCPCPLPGCAGGLGSRAALLRWLELAFKSVFVTSAMFVWIFTPMVTQGYEFWRTPWSATLGALSLAAIPIYSFPVTAVRFNGNIAVFELSERISHRMMRLALSDVLSSLRHRSLSAMEHGELPVPVDKPGPGNPADADLYVELHRALSATWRSRVSQTNFSTALVVSALTALVGSCIVMVSGGCLPAIYPAFLAYLALALVLVDLLNLAASNGQVSSVRALYHTARRELRELPDPPDPELRRAAARHDARLPGYLDDPGVRGKFLGLTVDYGVVRTVVVTTITLIVGIWSMLEGLGVRLTMDFART